MFQWQVLSSKQLPAVIINETSDKTMFIYYDRNALVNQTDVSLSPRDLHEIAFDSSSFSVIMVYAPASFTSLGLGFPVMQGDTVRISYDQVNDIYNFNGNHPRELSFYKKLALSDLALGGPSNSLSYGKKMPFKHFLKIWNEYKSRGEHVLKEAANEKGMRSEIVENLKIELRIRMFNVLLSPVFAQSSNEPIRAFDNSYRDMVNIQVKILYQEIPLTTSRLLPYALRNYAWYLLLSQNKYPAHPLLYEVAKQAYEGCQEDRALYFIMKEANRESFAITNLLNDYQAIATRKDFFVNELVAMERMNHYQILDDSLTNDTLVDRSGTFFKLHEIIKNNEGKIILIDIWASWCAPCLNALPLLIELEKKFENEGFVLLYFSIDEQKTNWTQTMNQHVGLWGNSYCFIRPTDFGLAKKFEIGNIPRYMILDRKGNVYNANAPSPDSTKLKEILNELSKM